MAPKRTPSTTTTTTTPASKKAKKTEAEVALHPSQVALARRATQSVNEGRPVIICGPPGYGKTRVARGMLDSMERPATLTIYVAKTPALARSQAAEIDALFKVPFVFSKLGGLLTAIQTSPPVRITMTQTMLKKLVYEGTFDSKLMAPLGDPTIHVVLDEAHGYYATTNARPSNAMRSLLQTHPTTLRVTGITATPQLDDHATKATSLFGAEPCVVEYTSAEEEQFAAELLSHQPRRATWKIIPLPSPEDVEEDERAALASITVGNCKAQPRVNIEGWMARDNLLNKILASQVLGSDGGRLFQQLRYPKGVSMRRVQEDGSFAKITRTESVLVCFHKPAGNETALHDLESLTEAEGVRPFAVHDLRSGDLAAAAVAREAFFQDVTTTDKTVIGIVDKGQTEGSNDFAKNVSTIVAVGNWSPAELTQLGGRLGRPCTLETNDLIPDAHCLLHVTSEWALAVSKIGLKRHSPRGVHINDAATEEWIDSLPEGEKDMAYKLVDGGEHLGTDLVAAYRSFDPEAYMSAVEAWRCYKD